MLHRVRSLAAVLMLGLPIAASAQPAPAPAPAPAAPRKVDPTATFLKQEKYTYCDVKLLSERWQTSAKEAKARIGLKIEAGSDDFLRTEREASVRTTKLKCTYTDG